MKMRPMGDQLLLLPSKKEDRTESGIILAGVEQSNGYAEVIAAGPGIFTQTGDRIPMACKVGDMVFPNSMMAINLQGIVAVLTKALQETVARLEVLESK